MLIGPNRSRRPSVWASSRGVTGGKIKDIESKEKSSNQILGLRYKDEAGEIESL